LLVAVSELALSDDPVKFSSVLISAIVSLISPLLIELLSSKLEASAQYGELKLNLFGHVAMVLSLKAFGTHKNPEMSKKQV